MKKLLLSISLLLLFSNSGYSATRRIYINFDNQPAVNATTGEFTPNTAPGEGKLFMVYWVGEPLPSILGKHHQYVAGRGGSGYAMSGVVNSTTKVGTWPYISWVVGQDVSWSSEIYVSFWMKYVDYKVDKAIKPYQNIKLFYWKFENAVMGEIAAGNVPNGDPPAYNEYTLSWRNQAYVDQPTPPGVKSLVYPTHNDSDGNWHHYEFHLNRASGRARWWIDGKLKHDWNGGYPNLGITPYYISWIHIAGSLIGTGPNSMGTRAFDDIEAWVGMPGSAPAQNPSIPPNPPDQILLPPRVPQ